MARRKSTNCPRWYSAPGICPLEHLLDLREISVGTADPNDVQLKFESLATASGEVLFDGKAPNA
jgi:hypothetical protein